MAILQIVATNSYYQLFLSVWIKTNFTETSLLESEERERETMTIFIKIRISVVTLMT